MTKTQFKTAYRLTKNLFCARRSGNIKREEAAYNKLSDWCDRYNFDIGDVIRLIRDQMRNSIADTMNGLPYV